MTKFFALCLMLSVLIFLAASTGDSVAADPSNNRTSKISSKSEKTDNTAKDKTDKNSIAGANQISIDSSGRLSSGIISDEWDKAYNDVLLKMSQAFSKPPNSESEQLPEDVFTALGVLTAANKEFDIQGLPEISMKLIAYAESLFEVGNTLGAKKLLMLSQGLSPNSSSVLFGLARFVKLYGIVKCSDLFLKGIVAISYETVACVNLICFCLLLITTSIVVAILIVCFVQIIFNLDDLQRAFSLWFPLAFRRVVAPFTLFFVIVFPLTKGLVVTIIVWSLLLGLLLSGRKLFHFVASLIMIISFFVFSEVSKIAHISWEDVIALEAINNGNTTPSAIHNVAVGERKGVLQEMRRATLGYLLLNFNKLSAAEEVLFFQVDKGPKEFEDLRLTNLVNKGALLLAKRDIGAARAVLKGAERAGERSFELFWNLSQVSLASIEMDEYRRYAMLARNINPERFENFEMRKDSGRGWLPKPLSHDVIDKYIWIILNKEVQGFLQRQEEKQIFEALSPFTSFESVLTFLIAELVVFFAIVLIGIPGSISQKTKRQPSQIWLFLPLGYQLASTRPLQATIGLGSMIGLLWSFEQVSKSSSSYLSHSRSLVWDHPLIWALAVIYCFFTIIGIWQWSRDANV